MTNITRTYDPLLDISEERRPGIHAIANQIAQEHPTWSPSRVATEAKNSWHQQQQGKENKHD